MSEPVPRMSDEDLKRFVLGYCDGRVFTIHDLRLDDPHLLRCVFLPLAFSNLSDHYDVEQVGTVWEWRQDAGPRAINGYPTFISLRVMHRDDWDRARQAIARELERRDALVV